MHVSTTGKIVAQEMLTRQPTGSALIFIEQESKEQPKRISLMQSTHSNQYLSFGTQLIC